MTPFQDLITDFNALQVKSCPKTQTLAKQYCLESTTINKGITIIKVFWEHIIY